MEVEIKNVDHFLEKLENLQKENNMAEVNYIPVSFNHTLFQDIKGDQYTKILMNGIIIVLCVFGYRMFKNTFSIVKSDIINKMDSKGGFGNMGGKSQPKSTHKLFNLEKDVKVTFDEVAGLQEAKEETKEFVDF